jgi:Golgi nucleoside diphosphatase
MGHTVIQGEVGSLAASIPRASHKFIDLLAEVGGSSTAQMIASYLDGASQNVGILFIKEGFDSMYIPPSAISSDPALVQFDGGVAVINIDSQMKIKGTAIPYGVSMMHELGHAKQYIEKPQWFEATYRAAMSHKSGKNQPQLDIENDNLVRHEAPILKDMGLPFRLTYD